MRRVYRNLSWLGRDVIRVTKRDVYLRILKCVSVSNDACFRFSWREERLILSSELMTSRQFLALFGSLKDVVFKWKLMWSRKRLEKKRALSTTEFILLGRHSRLNTSQLLNISNQLFLSLSRFEMDLFLESIEKKRLWLDMALCELRPLRRCFILL